MDILRTMIETGSCYVEIILCMYFFSAFKERRFSKPVTFLMALLGGCIYSLALYLLPAGGILYAASIAVTFFISLCYTFKWYVSVFMTVIISVISGLSEVIVMNLVTFTGLSFETANTNNYVYITGLFITKTFTYIIILLIRKGNHKSFQSIKNMRFLQLLLLPCAAIAISIIFAHFIYSYHVSTPLRMMSIVSQIILIISNVMIFNIIDSQYELISIREKLRTSHILMENQRLYYEDAFQSQQEIRRTRHDLKNIFIAMLGELNAGHVDETRTMIQSKLKEMEQYIYVDQSGDSVIESVIHSKEADANRLGIHMDVKLHINQDIRIDHLDLAVLIANLLDNAIEAANQVSADKYVRFCMITDNESIVITSNNPTVNAIEGNQLKTTKKDASKHGFGMMSIRSVVEKYNGSFVWNCEEGVFSVTIILPN
jgi:hypothetical protein